MLNESNGSNYSNGSSSSQSSNDKIAGEGPYQYPLISLADYVRHKILSCLFINSMFQTNKEV